MRSLSQSENARKRARELYRYLSATWASNGFADRAAGHRTTQDRSARDTDQQPLRRSAALSSDPSLTALAQLAVLKLNAERAFISLVDDTTQNIIAEATRSISLIDESQHKADEQLYLGAVSLDLKHAITPEAISVFSREDDSYAIKTGNMWLDCTRCIIYDMKKEEKYLDKSYVTGWPYMRFYAEVPIKSPGGYILGSVSIVDNEPRDRFTDDEISMLTDISDTVSRHLDLVTQAYELSRAERSLQALNLLIEGDSSLRQWSIQEYMNKDYRRSRASAQAWADEEYGFTHQADIPPSKSVQEASANVETSRSPGSTREASSGLLFSHQKSSETSVTAPSSSAALDSNAEMMSLSKSLKHIRSDSPVLSDSSVSSPDTSDVESGNARRLHRSNEQIQINYSKGSNLLREALDLEGVVFIESSGAPYQPLPSDTNPSSSIAQGDNSLAKLSFATGSESAVLRSDTISFESDSTPAALTAGVEHMARRIAYSTRAKSSLASNKVSPQRFSIPEHLLQYLLQHHPNGKVFSFDAAGLLSSSSGEDQPASRRSARHRKNRKNAKGEKKIDSDYNLDAIVLDSLPGVRSFIFYPLKDSYRDIWHAGCVAWTTDPRRVFLASELTYVAAFVNSIMSETSRLEACATDLAKSDFISSISHELRSPLHGILGSAELLRDGLSDVTQVNILGMIQKCGITLLDTMNHLLDFAKINALTRNMTQLRNTSQEVAHGGGIDLVSTFDIASLLEDLVEGLLVGHEFQRSRMTDRTFENLSDPGPGSVEETSSATPPVCILDIDRALSWLITSEVGAWKRIILNLLGNALKYTKIGHVKVKLRLIRSSQALEVLSVRKDAVMLSISDSGRGISQEYLQNHLYKPYAQEDAFSTGTGLGLSIVEQIVRSSGGRIEVQSESNIGTTVSILMPVDLPDHLPADTSQQHGIAQEVASGCQGLTLCLLALDDIPDIEKAPTGILNPAAVSALVVKEALTRQSMEWFGLRVISARNLDSVTTDLIMVHEENLALLESGVPTPSISSKNIPTVIVLHAKDVTQRFRGRRQSEASFHHLMIPYGPKQMARVLQQCLESRRFLSKSVSEMEEPGEVHSLITNSQQKMLQQRHLGASAEPQSAVYKTSPGSEPVIALNVLCVDDNDINVKILAACMKRLKCDFSTASNGAQAVEAYRSSAQPFHYILMDISMPVMDGFTASREIRQIERRRDVSGHRAVIIALTGLGSKQAQSDALKSGIDVFLTKPVPMQTLRELILTDSQRSGRTSSP